MVLVLYRAAGLAKGGRAEREEAACKRGQLPKEKLRQLSYPKWGEDRTNRKG